MTDLLAIPIEVTTEALPSALGFLVVLLIVWGLLRNTDNKNLRAALGDLRKSLEDSDRRANRRIQLLEEKVERLAAELASEKGRRMQVEAILMANSITLPPWPDPPS